MTPREDDDRSWLERMLVPTPDDLDPARALALLAVALLHQGQATPAHDLTRQADHLARWLR